MRTKLIYVLVSNENDIYLEQALISVFSARMQMQDAHICLIVDELTDKTFSGYRKNILQYITTKIVVDISNSFGEDFNNQQRSRILKTSVRKYIEGDFLFVDCDTIICEPLDEIDSYNHDFGAVFDAHVRSLPTSPYNKLVEEDAQKTNWPINHESIYFNSGVLFVKDNVATRKFYDDWNSLWFLGNSKKVRMDQPSFHMANIKNKHIVHELDGIWNCQLRHGIKYLCESKVIHYLYTNIKNRTEPIYKFMNEDIYHEIKTTGKINNETQFLIKNARKAFSDCVDIIPFTDIDFINSSIINRLHRMYLENNKVYLFLNKMLGIVYSIKRKLLFK